MRARYTTDRDGNLVEQPLPPADFEQAEHDARRGQREAEAAVAARKELLDLMLPEITKILRPDPNVYDDAGHPIGNYV